MDRFAHMVGEKVGDMVEGAVKSALGVKDKDKKDKKAGGGGILSVFGGDKKKDNSNKDEGKGGFFSNVFDKEDNNKGTPKKSGFSGLFSEQEGAGAASGGDGDFVGMAEESEVPKGPSVEGGGEDLYDDLLNVANEISTGK
ncbi:uncharacterized protein LOC113131749 isoform X2 [Mastacembelus armatus]|uniref:uncharacterized protein LOC113131749 isoform X2 n=1 Tax=Mastacembelus armatus TaxID=205130 RepID=UPI000E457651|nr:uncharacterized protein LOC113131749 isoform X2 [Mastacembelus armatus]